MIPSCAAAELTWSLAAAAVYTVEQQQRLGVDEMGKTVENAIHAGQAGESPASRDARR